MKPSSLIKNGIITKSPYKKHYTSRYLYFPKHLCWMLTLDMLMAKIKCNEEAGEQEKLINQMIIDEGHLVDVKA